MAESVRWHCRCAPCAPAVVMVVTVAGRGFTQVAREDYASGDREGFHECASSARAQRDRIARPLTEYRPREETPAP